MNLMRLKEYFIWENVSLGRKRYHHNWSKSMERNHWTRRQQWNRKLRFRFHRGKNSFRSKSLRPLFWQLRRTESKPLCLCNVSFCINEVQSFRQPSFSGSGTYSERRGFHACLDWKTKQKCFRFQSWRLGDDFQNCQNQQKALYSH